jgi:dTDP-4-amino-4,6-dideoxygalactose transaminase
MVGLNFKMNELTGAVALAQTRKLDGILDLLRTKKAKLKNAIGELPTGSFRKINDENGECATLLSIIFDNALMADKVASLLGQKTLIHSGWHVYRNMDQITKHKTPVTDWSEPSRYAQPGDLPNTDDILSRTINISIGVVDSGLGSGFGINLNSTDNEILSVAKKIKEAIHQN